MLYNNQGKQVQIPHISNQSAREVLLKPLRESLNPLPPKCGGMFKLGTRARLVKA